MNSYLKAGINLHLYNQAITEIKHIAQDTHKEEVISELGSFAALFDLSKLIKEYHHPILVSSTDGVGTKILIAQEVNEHDTLGIDLVAMCVNDLLTQGSTPLFFLDYFATGILNKEVLLSIIRGIATGCKYAHITLVGGETAEMPGMYNTSQYDLAGFVVGIVDKEKILPKSESMRENDYILGLASEGIHANGFALIRYIFANLGINYQDYSPWKNLAWKDVLLHPTKIYVDSILPIISQVKGIAHITGGGLIDNIPRIIPEGLFADIDINSWQWPELFIWLEINGKISKEEMLKTFNCGIGMILIVDEKNLEQVTNHFQKRREKISIIGQLRKKY
ncbi:phosphoribosylformylglycinamidine cyclo-ligase [Wolbachia endosymbiont of Howardula sp.]|uniref:phosphoribosylformylglycinamidine cyclo-ligase n=1 Tax=Wolbachia endosymbiont of Howardula sp. TaxID=2916816 RepID=UPI00217EE0B0|nr:phosphoribosylformylglycinamidine cyclo-ligase [Wolbachia endosymbiont of Howardula sp.]UWI83205.1 phosphoribosylformylglycinamidine cyclo-ligase [Wolbachia endosymbiont of Howardula sp.]